MIFAGLNLAQNHLIYTFFFNYSAFLDYLCAAWAADDGEDDYWKNEARDLAVQTSEELGRQPIVDEENIADNISVIVADLLRRLGRFDAVIRDYSETDYQKDMFNKIAAFQVEKARQHDSGLYTAGDVVGESS